MNKIKILNIEEIDELIEGIEDGNIIIGGEFNSTPEEIEEFAILRKKHMDNMSPEKKEELRKFVEKLRKEDKDIS